VVLAIGVSGCRFPPDRAMKLKMPSQESHLTGRFASVHPASSFLMAFCLFVASLSLFGKESWRNSSSPSYLHWEAR
jgi:hypothetical protein